MGLVPHRGFMSSGPGDAGSRGTSWQGHPHKHPTPCWKPTASPLMGRGSDQALIETGGQLAPCLRLRA